MKTQIRNFVMGAGLAALLWSPSLMAQVNETAEIPFDFHVGKATLPAGTYSVIKSSTLGILQFRNEDSGESILVGPQGREVANDFAKYDAKLMFHCYSGDCFLSAVWMPAAPGYTFWKSNREKELEKAGARLALTYVQFSTR